VQRERLQSRIRAGGKHAPRLTAVGTKRQFGDAPHQTAIETKLLFVVLIDLMTVTHIAAVAGFERRASVCLTIR
jgi:hypothetical protein